MSHPEHDPKQQEQQEQQEIDHWNARVGKHPAMPHLATLATALALLNIGLKLSAKGTLMPLTPADEFWARIGYGKRTLVTDSHGYASSLRNLSSATTFGSLRIGNVDASSSYIPPDVDFIVAGRRFGKPQRILGSALTRRFETSPLTYTQPMIGIVALHQPYDSSESGIELTTRDVPQEIGDEFLLPLLESESAMNSSLMIYDSTKAYTIKKQVAINPDPECHFYVQQELGVASQDIALARSNFNVMAELAKLPYQVATE